jgi:hypothetical protein
VTNDLARLQLGTAPDSWGVWFPSDAHQVGRQQYLVHLPDQYTDMHTGKG